MVCSFPNSLLSSLPGVAEVLCFKDWTFRQRLHLLWEVLALSPLRSKIPCGFSQWHLLVPVDQSGIFPRPGGLPTSCWNVEKRVIAK